MKKTFVGLAVLTAAMGLNARSTTPETEAAGSAAPSQSSSTAPSSTAPSSTPSATTATTGVTEVTITAGHQTFNATINDSGVSRDLATLPATKQRGRYIDSSKQVIVELS